MEVRNFSVLAYALGLTLWLYKADAATHETLEAPGFFDPAAGMLGTGDMIILATSEGSRLRSVRVTDGEVQLQAPV